MKHQNDDANRFHQALEKAWRYLRQVTGDAAYENYQKYCATKKRDSNPNAATLMTRAEFYSDSVKRKYSTINRCC